MTEWEERKTAIPSKEPDCNKTSRIQNRQARTATALFRDDSLTPSASQKPRKKHTSANAAVVWKNATHRKGGPTLLCAACDSSKTIRPTIACRSCNKVYHPVCAGYEPHIRRYPPPCWICPLCPNGERGTDEEKLHPMFMNRGTKVLGSQPWCPICLQDNRVPGSRLTDLDGRKCNGCGLKAHSHCLGKLDIKADEEDFPCDECRRRRDTVSPGSSMSARLQAAKADGGWKVKTSPVSRAAMAAVVAASAALPASSTRLSANGRGKSSKLSKGHGRGENAKRVHTSSGSSASSTCVTDGKGDRLPARCNGSVGQENGFSRRSATSSAGTTPAFNRRLASPSGKARQRKGTAAAARLGSSPSPTAVGRKHEMGNCPAPGAPGATGPAPKRLKKDTTVVSTSLEAGGAGAGTATTKAASPTCQNCKKRGDSRWGKTCGGCERWWHDDSNCWGANVCPGTGEWVGSWRCRGCLCSWEKGLKERAARVICAWAEHEARRVRDAEERAVAQKAAAAESKEEQRYGFAVGNVDVVSAASFSCMSLTFPCSSFSLAAHVVLESAVGCHVLPDRLR